MHTAMLVGTKIYFLGGTTGTRINNEIEINSRLNASFTLIFQNHLIKKLFKNNKFPKV